MKYGVIETSSIHIPGDERSRQCPGHGYPAHTETIHHLHEFEDEDSLRTFLKNRDSVGSLGRCRVIRFENLNVNREVSFAIS